MKSIAVVHTWRGPETGTLHLVNGVWLVLWWEPKHQCWHANEWLSGGSVGYPEKNKDKMLEKAKLVLEQVWGTQDVYQEVRSYLTSYTRRDSYAKSY